MFCVELFLLLTYVGHSSLGWVIIEKFFLSSSPLFYYALYPLLVRTNMVRFVRFLIWFSASLIMEKKRIQRQKFLIAQIFVLIRSQIICVGPIYSSPSRLAAVVCSLGHLSYPSRYFRSIAVGVVRSGPNYCSILWIATSHRSASCCFSPGTCLGPGAIVAPCDLFVPLSFLSYFLWVRSLFLYGAYGHLPNCP